MTKKIYVDDAKVRSLVLSIAREITLGDWKPEYIVGISRGGLTPAVLMSHYLNVPLYTLKVTLRDGTEEDCDHNCWMSEDAMGYGRMGCLEDTPANILVIDDINDSGATFAWIKKDWRSGCLPDSPLWDEIWGKNVRFASLIHNLASSEPSDYTGMEINKAEDPSWIVFPWENWWER
jgi:hypothetical protein